MVLFDRLIYFFLCTYIVTLPIIPSVTKNKYVHFIPDILLLLIFSLFLLKLASNKKNLNEFFKNLKDFLKDYLGISFVLFFLVMGISVIYSYDKNISISESLRFLSYILLFFIVKFEIKDKRQVHGLIDSYIFVIIIVCVYGLIQNFTGFGLDNKFVYQSATGVIKEKVFSFLENPNNLGAFLVIGFFPIFMLMLQEKKIGKKLLYLFINIIMLINVILTISRNSLIAIAIGIIVISIFYSWKAIIALGGLSVLFMMIPQVSTRLKSVFLASSNADRISLWKVALKMIKDHPILGVGNGNYISLYDSYVKKYPELRYSNFVHFPSHNSYLKVASELGLVGISVFVFILICSLKKIIHVIKYYNDPYFQKFYIGFLASTIAFYFMNISDNLFFFPKTTCYFWIFIAIADNLMYHDKKI